MSVRDKIKNEKKRLALGQYLVAIPMNINRKISRLKKRENILHMFEIIKSLL